MRRSIKTSLTILLIVLVVGLPLVSYAQNQVRMGQNLRVFFRQFVSVRSTFTFIVDDTIQQNQCKRRDLMALYGLQSSISENIIKNYGTLTVEELEYYKELYAATSSKIVFVRRIEMLRNPVTEKFDLSPSYQNALREHVLRKTTSAYRGLVLELFDSWIEEFSTRLDEYDNCENSWTKVKTKIDSIKDSAQNIVREAREFKQTFNSLTSEIADTPEAVYLGAVGVVEESYDALEGSWQKTVEDYQAVQNMVLTERNRLIRETREEQARLHSVEGGLESAFASGQTLDSLVNTLALTIDEMDFKRTYSEEQARQKIVNFYYDTANPILLDYLIQTNQQIQITHDLLSDDAVGLSSLATKIESKQCSA